VLNHDEGGRMPRVCAGRSAVYTLTKGMERTGFQASIEEPLLVDGNMVPKDADVYGRLEGAQRDRNLHRKIRTKTWADGNRCP
jgi:hypothetical protein